MANAAKQAIKQISSIENRIATSREYTRLWQEYFKFFADGFDERKIFDEDEKKFFMLMNVLAMNHFRFTELSAPHFKSGDEVLRILTETPSLAIIKGMSEAQFSKLLIDWHTQFIVMNKAIGRLNQELPPPNEKAGKKAA